MSCLTYTVCGETDMGLLRGWTRQELHNQLLPASDYMSPRESQCHFNSVRPHYNDHLCPMVTRVG